MKKINIVLFFLALAVAFGCQPDAIKPIGDPADKQAMMVGEWQLTSMIQQDEVAAQKGFPAYVTRMDITSVFPDHPYTDLSITLNADGTFAVAKGRALVDLPQSGTWSFDDEKYVSALILVDAQEVETRVEFGGFDQLHNGEMALTSIRRDADGKAFLSYEYSFSKN